jgi:hypothetical protein
VIRETAPRRDKPVQIWSFSAGVPLRRPVWEILARRTKSILLFVAGGAAVGNLNFAPALATTAFSGNTSVSEGGVAYSDDCRMAGKPSNTIEFLYAIRKIYVCDLMSRSSFYKADYLPRASSQFNATPVDGSPRADTQDLDRC